MALAATLAGGLVVAGLWPDTALDWQASRTLQEPWRAWTAVWVHGSARHLAVNLMGLVLVAALGWRAALPARAAIAWAAAWPLVQAGLWWHPQLDRYGGLSGVLHAGVVVAALHLAVARAPRQRLVAWALLAGLVLKLVQENPFGPARVPRPELGIDMAPLAHTTGAAAGAATAGLMLWALRARGR